MWNVPQFKRTEMLTVRPLERGLLASLTAQAILIEEDMQGRDAVAVAQLATMLLGQAFGEYLWLKMDRPACYVPLHLAELFRRSNFDVDINSLRLPIDSFMLMFPKEFRLSDGTPLDQVHIFNLRSSLAEKMVDGAAKEILSTAELEAEAASAKTESELERVEILGGQCALFDSYRDITRQCLFLVPYFDGAQIGGRAMRLGQQVKSEPNFREIKRPGASRRKLPAETILEACNIAIASLCRYTTRPETVKDFVLPRSERYNHKGDKKQKKIFCFLDPKIVNLTGYGKAGEAGEPTYSVKPHVRGFVYATLRDERWYRKNPLKPGEPLRIQEREPTIIHPEAFEPATK